MPPSEGKERTEDAVSGLKNLAPQGGRIAWGVFGRIAGARITSGLYVIRGKGDLGLELKLSAHSLERDTEGPRQRERDRDRERDKERDREREREREI